MDKAKDRSEGKETEQKEDYQICFVIMPFGGWFDIYYKDLFCPAIQEAGLMPHRADDLSYPGVIVKDIWNYTKQAKMVVADLTGRNPNVLYELGLAHAIAKPAILLAQSIDDIPFDLQALRVIVYDKSAPDWGNMLKTKITQYIKEVLESPLKAVLPVFLEVTEVGEEKVTRRDKEMLEIRQDIELLKQRMSTLRPYPLPSSEYHPIPPRMPPSIRVIPNVGPPGTNARISGSGLGSNSRVSIVVDGVMVANLRASEAGMLDTRLHVADPDGRRHNVLVVASDEQGNICQYETSFEAIGP